MIKRRSTSKNIVFTIAFVFFVLYCSLLIFFFVFGFLVSIKSDMVNFTFDQIDKKLFSWPLVYKNDIPSDKFWDKIVAGFNGLMVGLKNYKLAFGEWERVTEYKYSIMTWNSIWRSILPTTVGMMTSAIVTYIIVFYKCKYTKFLYFVGLLINMIPLYGNSASTYRLVYNLHLINTPFHYITCATLYSGSFFYMCAFWRSISWEYAEAAYIDGAGDWTIFFKVMFPMVLPSMSALVIMSLISDWNNYSSTLLYMTDFPNLAYGIYAYSEMAKYEANVPVYFAGVLIALIPVFTLFIVFQDTIMTRVYMGGLKG